MKQGRFVNEIVVGRTTNFMRKILDLSKRELEYLLKFRLAQIVAPRAESLHWICQSEADQVNIRTIIDQVKGKR